MRTKVQLFHNPKAGDGDHQKKDLVKAIETAGHTCVYTSIKDKSWQKIAPGVNWVAVAGGDGAVKRVIQFMDGLKLSKDLPIGLLPLGTANNVASSLGIDGEAADLIANWGKNTTCFDVGRAQWGKKEIAFGEGAGFGLFPWHMTSQAKSTLKNPTVQEKLQYSLKRFLGDAKSFRPRYQELTIDGKKYPGEYLMVEMLNIRSIGPNLVIADDADPGDGWLDVILVTENHRDQLLQYLTAKLDGLPAPIQLQPIRAKEVIINSTDQQFHIDDKTFTLKQQVQLTISVDMRQLQFFV